MVVVGMKRAVELFALETRPSRSSLVEETWLTRSTRQETFISVAATHWEMVVTRQRGAGRLTVRGPETRATTLPIPQDAEFFGIQFSVGTFMPGLPPGRLVDEAVAAMAGVFGAAVTLRHDMDPVSEQATQVADLLRKVDAAAIGIGVASEQQRMAASHAGVLRVIVAAHHFPIRVVTEEAR